MWHTKKIYEQGATFIKSSNDVLETGFHLVGVLGTPGSLSRVRVLASQSAIVICLEITEYKSGDEMAEVLVIDALIIELMIRTYDFCRL